MGRLETAIAPLVKCLELRKAKFGELAYSAATTPDNPLGDRHVSVAAVKERLGKAYLGLGDIPRAKAVLELAVSILEADPAADQTTRTCPR